MIHNGRPPGEPLFHDAATCRGCRAKTATVRVAHETSRHVRHYAGHVVYEVAPGVLAICAFEYVLRPWLNLGGPHTG